MDNTETNTLAGIVEAVREIASTQRTHSDLLRMLVEGQAEIIKQLTPGPKDGPSLEELLSHIIGQLKELTSYSRQIVKGQSDMEQTADNPGGEARRLVQAEAVRRTLARHVAGLSEALQRNAQSLRGLGQDIDAHLRGLRVDAEASQRKVEAAVRKPSSSPTPGM